MVTCACMFAHLCRRLSDTRDDGHSEEVYGASGVGARYTGARNSKANDGTPTIFKVKSDVEGRRGKVSVLRNQSKQH